MATDVQDHYDEHYLALPPYQLRGVQCRDTDGKLFWKASVESSSDQLDLMHHFKVKGGEFTDGEVISTPKSLGEHRTGTYASNPDVTAEMKQAILDAITKWEEELRQPLSSR